MTRKQIRLQLKYLETVIALMRTDIDALARRPFITTSIAYGNAYGVNPLMKDLPILQEENKRRLEELAANDPPKRT